jgi:hypothetical protein
MSSPKLVPLVLTDAEREALELLVRKRTASQALDRTAPILLMLPMNPGRATRTLAKLAFCRDLGPRCQRTCWPRVA